MIQILPVLQAIYGWGDHMENAKVEILEHCCRKITRFSLEKPEVTDHGWKMTLIRANQKQWVCDTGSGEVVIINLDSKWNNVHSLFERDQHYKNDG